MSEKLMKAQEYVKTNQSSVCAAYRPRFHIAPPVGWINDPNGFCFFKGQYHLFAQYHPYDSVWGPMHWGHWVSDELVTWNWIGVALAPDCPYDDLGCFSGTALETDGKLTVIYTGVHRDEQGVVVQEQCIAQSDDGVHFEKWACNPVIGAKDLPEGSTAVDFRDPKLLRTPDGYRVIVAHRGSASGRQLSFTSADLKNWNYDGILLENVGEMPECPDYSHCGGKELMLTSVMNLPQDGLRFQNGHHDVVYLIGQEKNGSLIPECMESVDLGTDFYAPESIETPDGRHVMIGWMDMWGEESPTHYLHHGWRGQYTCAREIFIREGRLFQRPVRELEKLRGSKTEAAQIDVHGETAVPGLAGRRYEMEIELQTAPGAQAEIRLLQEGDAYFSIRYDAATRQLTADRSKCGYTMGKEGAPEARPMGRAVLFNGTQRLKLRILVDTSSVELFANDGALAMTSLAFPKGEACGISFAGEFTIVSLRKWELAQD